MRGVATVRRQTAPTSAGTDSCHDESVVAAPAHQAAVRVLWALTCSSQIMFFTDAMLPPTVPYVV